MQDAPQRESRQWTDAAVIAAGLVLAGLAVWPPGFLAGDDGQQILSVWQVYAIIIGLSLVALFVGQRWQRRTIARLMLLEAVVVLMGGLLTVYRDRGPAAWLIAALPGLLLIAAIPFVRPMRRWPGSDRR